jgi:FKBP-type peptidyl-prolyl cis-trans isomerase
MIKRNTGKVLGLAAIVTLALAACGDNAFGPDPTEVTFAASLGIDLANMTMNQSGLYYRDDVIGEGATAAANDIATVTYSGYLVDGTQFDGGIFQFVITSGGAIAGFVEGVTGMRVGGERTLVVPPELAYGSSGFQGIPGDAVLVFDVALDVLATP